jgi:hypothetical protein
MITKEEFEKAVEVCNSEFKTCEDCPLRHKAFLCGVYLTKYIKNELAPAATDTSSEVSVKEDTDNIHLDDNTKRHICQAYNTADEACANMLTIYEGMLECEQRAFDIGEIYGKIFGTRSKLEGLIGASGREGE